MLKSSPPENVKNVPNRLLTCLECEESVYAKYLCRNHYEVRRREKDRIRREAERAEKRQAKAEALKLHLETNGSYCLIPSCILLTVRETGLCKAHENRAKRWQMSPAEIVAIFSEDPECKICGSTEALVLDHQHGATCEDDHIRSNGCLQCFRGLLCNSCNTGIGFLGDNPDRLRLAASYLENYSQGTPS